MTNVHKTPANLKGYVSVMASGCKYIYSRHMPMNHHKKFVFAHSVKILLKMADNKNGFFSQDVN